MSDENIYVPITQDIELVERCNSDSLDTTCDLPLNWNSEACQECENEKWEIPFAVGKSTYLPCHVHSKNKSRQEHLYDILEVPIVISKESDYCKYADQIVEILHQPHKMGWDNMKWNFDSSIKYMNLILYVPELDQGLTSPDIMIPKTAIPLLGNTFHELISRTKAWLFAGGSSTPISDMIGEGVYKTTLQEKSLVQGLKKRLEMTSLISRYTEGVNESVESKTCSRFELTSRCCNLMSECLCPFSNLHIILKHCSDDNIFEKLLYTLGRILRLPTLKLIPQKDHTNKLTGFDVDYIDPYQTELKEKTSQFYNLEQVQTELYQVILSKADDFFHRNDDPYTGWNIITMAIFLNDNQRVARAFTKAHFAALNDELQIERIFRYSLVYGSQSVVRAVFEDDALSKLLMKRYQKILDLTFYKSSNEVFLYNRLMIALKIVDHMGNKRLKYASFLQLIEVAIQTLMANGFLWVAPVNMCRCHDVDHIYVFFPEYVMLWGVLSQRFEVVELFLMYSGLHLQYISDDPFCMSTSKGVYQICNALAISSMLDGLANLLESDTSVTRADFDRLIEQSKHFDQIATDMLDYALRTDENSLRILLNTPSPFWSNKCALELAQIGRAYKFLNHHAVHIFLQHLWRGYDALRQEEGERIHIPQRIAYSIFHPYTKRSFQLFYTLINAARIGYFLHGVYFLFVILCGIGLLAFGDPKDDSFFKHIQPLEWVLFVCLLGFTIEEVRQYIGFVLVNFKTANISHWRIVLKLSFYEYFGSIWNKLDILIILTFILSIIIRVFSLFYPNFPIYLPRLVYGITAIPIFIRSFQHILVIKTIGPLIYTMYQGFLKMLKFLLIILILSLAVGTLQIALLKPTTQTSTLFKHLIFTPFFQIFGEYFFDELLSDTYKLSQFTTRNVTTSFLDIFWSRSDWILFLVVAIWVLIINVLILNLMIAYFTQIYDQVAAIARSIYIWQFIEIVQEFQSRNIFPPPFNLLFIPVQICRYLWSLKRNSNKIRHNELLERVGAKRMQNNKINVYFATHYENSFADKFWKFKMQKMTVI